jgi:hypothetical protein
VLWRAVEEIQTPLLREVTIATEWTEMGPEGGQ